MESHGESLAGLADQHVKDKSWGLLLAKPAKHQVWLTATLSQQVSLPLMALILEAASSSSSLQFSLHCVAELSCGGEMAIARPSLSQVALSLIFEGSQIHLEDMQQPLDMPSLL